MGNERDPVDSDNRVKAVHKTFTIIEYLHDHSRCTVSELAEGLNMPASTVTVHLQTLNDLGYVIRAEDGTYRLSLRFLEYGGQTRNELDIYLAAHPQIDKLSRETEEVATMGVKEQDQRVLLYRTEPIKGISDNAPVGEHTDLHWTALGKALLSRMTDSEIVAIADSYGLPKATENTITDVEDLLAEISVVRERGYSIEDEERIEGIRSVAVPIRNLGPETGPAAISVAGPKHRFSDERIETELVDTLQDVENVIELQCNHYRN
ncbi:IclR family transcriptional regulator [Halorhabdus amylolytica]|uniref:IclR family transcriptional regulator n=1 Tax=Halorhabdus amylolytica TaxID=2559573 RepID=UPI0010AB13FB|nr:IclR family transcriptional regulator [Halorhabdus amylolytica]